MKRLFVVVCALIVSLTWAVPAQAAPSAKRTPPSAPTAVAAVAGKSSTQAVLSWSSPTDSGSRKVYGYSIVKEGGGSRTVYWQKADRQTVKSYSRTFSSLKPGLTYTFTVKAWSLAGSSPAAKAQFTTKQAPTVLVPTVYSVDTPSGSLVSFPVGGGASKVIFSGAAVSNLIADPMGNVFFLAAGSVMKAPAGGGAVTTVAGGVTGALGVDDAGNVYGVSGLNVVRIAPSGQQSVIFTSASGVSDIAVTASGVVSVNQIPDGFGTTTTVATVPAGGGTAVTRTLFCGGYCLGKMLGDDKGTLYLDVVATGASGFRFWNQLPAGATDITYPEIPLAEFSAAVAPSNLFYLLETTSTCVGPPVHPENPDQTPCVANRAVKQIETFAPSGAPAPTDGEPASVSPTSVVPVSGLVIPESGADIAVNAAGSVFVASAAGIARFAPSGGAPTLVAAGSYDQIVVVG